MIGATPTAWCRRDSKGGAMFLFVCLRFRGAQGKNREPGLQAFYVSKMTESRSPLRAQSKLVLV